MMKIKSLLKKEILLMALFSVLLISCNEKKEVLIIGDSISIGYTPFVKESLADLANVSHNYKNGGSTQRGVDSICSWLGDYKWDVVYFNFGLHDLCYYNDAHKKDREGGKQMVPLADYEKNLRTIVAEMKKTGAQLIFATTTVVPEMEPGRYTADVEKYNAVARKVMKENNISVTELYEPSKNIHSQFGLGIKNVHYKEEGYKELSTIVVKEIKERL